MNTVVIKSIDREKVSAAALTYARELRTANPEIIRIIWFGSWIHGIPAPGSDVDLCLILSQTDIPFRHRSSQYLPVGFPVGIDLFVYTQAEFEGLSESAPGWKLEILKGIDL